MPDDGHLHHAAAALREILERRQPDYRWHVDVLPRNANTLDTERPLGATGDPALRPTERRRQRDVDEQT
jgi:hypothetical protein